MTTEYRSIELRLTQTLDVGLRSTLVERMQRIRGVIEPVFEPPDFHRLTVRCQNGSLSPATLLSFLASYGVNATLATEEALA